MRPADTIPHPGKAAKIYQAGGNPNVERAVGKQTSEEFLVAQLAAPVPA